jgi:hypothetical protein
MDGNIYSISILNFNSEIGFFVKRPEFPSYISENFSQQITKFIFKNYLCKHPSQRYFYVSMEHSISSKLRAKISLTGKLCIIIIFSSSLDIYYVNLFHDGIKNTLYYLSGNKKIKMDDYRNEYLQLNKVLLNALYLINPNEKIMFKHSQESTNERLLLGYYNIYFQRMFYTVQTVKKMIFNLETQEYNKKKNEYNYIHKINKINDKAKFKLTPKLVGIFLKKKEKRKKFFLEDENSNNIKDNKNNDEDININKQ